jgi:hypothetical protein
VVALGGTEAAIDGADGRRVTTASIHSLQLAVHQPWRDVLAEPGSESLRRPDHGRQGLDLDDNADGARRDGLRPKRFDKADFGSDRVHDFAKKRPRVERGHELPMRPLSILTHPRVKAAATESVYFTGCCRDSSTAEHQLRLLKTEVRLLHSAPARREANGPLLQHIRLILRKRACDVSTEKPPPLSGGALGTRRPRGPEGICEHTDLDGAAVFAQACRMVLEGIVSKRLSAPYRSGPSRDWIKVKNPDSPAMIRAREAEW